MSSSNASVLGLTPGCVIRDVEEPDAKKLWVVTAVDDARRDGVWLQARPFLGGAARWMAMERARSGFLARMDVEDVPSSSARRSYGTGQVVATRALAGREQVLVEFYDGGQRVWMPYERLAISRSAAQRFCAAQCHPEDAERFRLRVLAHMLKRWHENTGALAKLEIDPLPHQLHLVHHILRSGNFNWMIADDVGLGKTIEVGMLLSALLARKEFDRVLIVTPSGLTTQWQEELRTLFGLDDFLVYGRDFRVNHGEHWRMYPRVIASMDQLKQESHLELLMQSGRWDMVVFDEGHRLTRHVYGMTVRSSERYLLAQALRQQTEHMMLLTATPHQGKEEPFVALLELLRPEWAEEFSQLHQHGQLLREMIYRNRKIDVTDAQGEFIFKGQDSYKVDVERGDAELVFDRMLQDYLREGYARAQELGHKGQAIGFVMTVFRKLASSSHAAILRALRNRRARLVQEYDALIEEAASALALDDDELGSFAQEQEEAYLEQRGLGVEFFDGELERLEELIALSEQLNAQDIKLQSLFEHVIEPMVAQDPGKRLLIFTEFRATQDHLERALVERFGQDRVVTISGGQDVKQRIEAVEAFRDKAQFMISTEAGGEGLNLHYGCATMVNYDLPWNPMRMVQRMGRLYRYGQKERVKVFNLSYGATLDARVVELIYARLDKVVEDMGKLSDEYNARWHAEVLGETAQLLDVKALLAEASQVSEQRSQQRIDEAVQRAQAARALQEDILADVMRFDPQALKDELELGREHVASFALGMLHQLGCAVDERTHQGKVWQVRLSEEVQQALHTRRSVVRLTAYRDLGRASREIEVLDMKHPLFKLMLARALSHSFGGLHAAVSLKEPWAKALVLGQLRWQDEQGHQSREEVVAVAVDAKGQTRAHPKELTQWLCESARSAGLEAPASGERQALIEAAQVELDRYLGRALSRYLHPLQRHILAAAALA